MKYSEMVKRAKLRLLRMHYERGVGHIGSDLSAIDAMLLLHHKVMHHDDVFVLSKGHAAGALYITLWTLGALSDKQLEQFHEDGSKMAGHPVAGWVEGIPLSTGSLGHGLPMAAGVALAKKFKQEPGNVFCLMSDGEWEEGSNWEALIFMAHHQLSKLTVLIDANHLQAFGRTSDIASLDPLAEKFHGFEVDIQEIDGHDWHALELAHKHQSKKPKMIILHTVKGHGVSYMEHLMEWHYLSKTEEQYLHAAQEINQT
jgi:transketolase